MDIYRYVNRTNHVITTTNYTIPIAGEYVSYNAPVAELDRIDGTLVDKYKNLVPRQDPSEFNYYHPVISSEKGDGVLLNIDDPKAGWHDLLSATTVDRDNASKMPDFNAFVGSIKKYQFAVGDESFHNYHLPHDYLPGSDIYIHVHWAHTSVLVTGGSTTWNFEASYSKGYNQGQFNTPVNVQVTQDVVVTPLTHQIAEIKLSIPGGSASQLDSNLLETDGLILVRTSLVSNTIGVNPFMLFCDLHYQSTGIPTKNRNYNFWQ